MGEHQGITEYYRIYEEIYENPFISCSAIAEKTGIPEEKVDQYLREMYEKSILKGPFIALRPAENYHQYAYFLKVEDPFPTFKTLEGEFIYLNMSCGDWNLLVITGKKRNFSRVPGFRECILRGVKSATSVSRVVSLNWEEAIKKIEREISPPEEKTNLYEEIPSNSWGKQEWEFYCAGKNNARNFAQGISHEKLREWISTLGQFAYVQPAFYPGGLKNYYAFDLLFHSGYHAALKDLLGLLPSSSLFFSVSEYCFARLFFPNKEEQNDVLSLIEEMGKEGFYTQYTAALALFSRG